MKKYVFKPYSTIFPELFEKEKERILAHIKMALTVEHVGSTAIPNLGGKGIIDIGIAVDKEDMGSVSKQLQDLGYEFRPAFSTKDRLYFIIYLPDSEEETRRYHIHLTYPENKEWKEFLEFRDYLRNHPRELKEYAELKHQAALEADHKGERYRKIKEPMFEKIRSLITKTNNRPKISIYIATSIDGYIARTDGSLDWLDRVGGFDQDYGFQKLLDSIDGVILGRNTYEVAASVPDWPYKGKRIVVLSNSLQSVRGEAELFRGDLTQLVSQLHSDGIKHVWIDGGVTISQFLKLQMVDCMTLSVIPVILGDGMPLFNVIGKEIPCRLTSSQSYPSGLVQLKYEIEVEGIDSSATPRISSERQPEKTMRITLEKATKEDKDTIQNLGRFYVYDMSRYCGFLPTWETPPNGLFECIDLSSYCDKLDRHAFLIKVDEELAGFALINKVGSTPDVDWNVGEFFIVSKFQGKGVGSYVAEQIFNQFPGIWETTQIPENKAAIDFWEKVVNKYSNGKFEKTHKIIPAPKPHPMIVLKFNSKKVF